MDTSQFLTSWPLVDVRPRLTDPRKWPRVPLPPPVPSQPLPKDAQQAWEMVSRNPAYRNAFLQRVFFLVSSHPHVEIAQGLKQAGLARQVAFVGHPSMDLDARFFVREATPAISMGVNAVMDLRSPGDVLDMMLIIFHEDRHRRQWLGATGEDRQYFELAPPGPRTADLYWKYERAAHLETCLLANSWGFPRPLPELCARTDDSAAFDQALFHWMVGEVVPALPQFAPFVPRWAVLAGHPNPSV